MTLKGVLHTWRERICPLQSRRAKAGKTLGWLFFRPHHLSQRSERALAVLGRIGWFFKALIYSVIGGLACDSITLDKPHNQSPQGVFIFVSSGAEGVGVLFLIIVLVGVLMYAFWRIVEGLVWQGYTQDFSKKKNFFRYRLSPLVSGGVYLAYAYGIIQMLKRRGNGENAEEAAHEQNSKGCFPRCWRDTGIGIFGLFVLSLALFCAFISQIIPMYKGHFMQEMVESIYDKKQRWAFYLVQYTGRVGFFGRALMFLLISITFVRAMTSDPIKEDSDMDTFGQALDHWRRYTLGKIALFIMGFCLVVYGLFALLCIRYKRFPTRWLVEPPNNSSGEYDEESGRVTSVMESGAADSEDNDEPKTTVPFSPLHTPSSPSTTEQDVYVVPQK